MRPLADEVPFDIPDSWEWCRFSSLITLLSGTSYQKNDVCNSGIRILRGGNIQSYKLILEDSDVFLPLEYRDEEKNIQPGDTILVASTGSKSVIGKPAFVDKEYPNTQIGAFLRIARPIDPIIADYIALIFETEYYREHIRHSVQGTNINNIKAEYIENLLIPLPPHEEQVRVLAKLSGLEPALVQYDNVENTLQSLNASFPEALKKSILQEAVQGKLVPQDPSDEPAEALLERIRAEKQRLIKEGKIKKDKHESVIFRRDNSHYEKRDSEEVCIDEEIPFEIPENWAWCRASSLGTMIRGRGIKRTETVAQGCPCIRYGEIYTTYETSFDSAVSFVPETLDKDCLHFSSGDVVFTLTGENKVDIAKTVAFLGEGQIAAGGDLAFWTHHGMNPLYLVYYMASPYCIELKRRTATGDIIVHISTSKVGDFLVPIPPIKEQNRIVSAIEQLFAVASTL